jgi:hypothetical protein
LLVLKKNRSHLYDDTASIHLATSIPHRTVFRIKIWFRDALTSGESCGGKIPPSPIGAAARHAFLLLQFVILGGVKF